MPDTRFTTVADDPYELVEIVDVDSLDDIETLLMCLLHRPVMVREEETGADATAVEVIVQGNELSQGTVHDFPISMLEIARDTGQTVVDLGPYDRNGFTDEDAPDVLALSDDELIAALQEALGTVRIFKSLYDEDDEDDEDDDDDL